MKGQDQWDYLAMVLEGPTKCSMPPMAISRHVKQKISKDIEELNHIVHQQHVIDSSRTLHTTTVEYTFSSSAHGMLTKIDCILDHKTNLDIFKNRACFLTTMGSNQKSVTGQQEKKISQYLEIKQSTLNPWVKEEVSKDIKKYLEPNKTKMQHIHICRMNLKHC